MPLSDEDDTFDEYTYAGALRIAIQQLRGNFPDATIVLCSPNYAQFWGKDGSYLGDGNMVNNGGGALVEYHRVCGNVSADMNTLFLNGYEGIGLEAYIRSQYGFWGYGIWALTERETGAIIGKAGVTNLEWGSKENGEEEALELGYHIFRPWRGRGYGTEACEGILSWCAARGNMPVYAKTDASNEASAALLKKLGFRLTDQRYTEPGQRHNLFVRNY